MSVDTLPSSPGGEALDRAKPETLGDLVRAIDGSRLLTPCQGGHFLPIESSHFLAIFKPADPTRIKATLIGITPQPNRLLDDVDVLRIVEESDELSLESGTFTISAAQPFSTHPKKLDLLAKVAPLSCGELDPYSIEFSETNARQLLELLSQPATPSES